MIKIKIIKRYLLYITYFLLFSLGAQMPQLLFFCFVFVLFCFVFTANLLPLVLKNYTLVSGEYKCFLSFSFRLKLI